MLGKMPLSTSIGHRARYYSITSLILAIAITSQLCSGSEAGLVGASAAAEERYFVGNYSPLTQLFGLPTLDPSAGSAEKALTVGVQLISVSNSDSDANESLILDGELTRIDVSYQQQLTFAQRWLEPAQLYRPRIRLQLPLYYQGGGFMDDTIETWHKVFNLPNGNRDELETNNLLYRYVRDGQTLLDFQDESAGIGDASIEITVDAMRHTEKATRTSGSINLAPAYLSFALGAKFPTGSESKITGSGGTDLYALLAATNPVDLRHWGIHNQLNLGYLRAENSGPLSSIQNGEMFFARLNLYKRLNTRWSIISHFYYHQAPYESDMEAIGEDALIGNFGVAWRTTGRSLTIYFGEDLEAGKSPDFSIGASLAVDLKH